VISRLGVIAVAMPISLLATTAMAATVTPGTAGPHASHSYGAARSQPRRDPYYPSVGVTSVDVLHYGLDLRWDDTDGVLSGTATIRFRATRQESAVALDLGQPLQVSEVRLDGHVVASTHHHNVLRMKTARLGRHSRHTLTITYSGHPQPVRAPTNRSDIPRVGWTTTGDGQAWSTQEPFGAFTWYPVNDHPSDKAFYDITLRTKKAWHGVTDGQLRSDKVVGNERVMRWHLGSPAASYLIALDIGPYRAYSDTGPHGLPITYWVRPEDRWELKYLRRTPTVLKWLESRLGRYPFAELGVVMSPTRSAEETQTMVTMGVGVLSASYGVSDLAHELAHQWYGDEVTPDNWPDLWMNESFAMYIQIRWEAAHHVESIGQWRSYLNHYDQQFRRNDGPPGEYHKRQFAENSVYYCGALMLDRLHSMLPTAVFAKVLRDWPRLHRFGSVHRSEWVGYLDRITGRNVTSFVHQWLDSPTTPS
jgi:aminopeptidase N